MLAQRLDSRHTRTRRGVAIGRLRHGPQLRALGEGLPRIGSLNHVCLGAEVSLGELAAWGVSPRWWAAASRDHHGARSARSALDGLSLMQGIFSRYDRVPAPSSRSSAQARGSWAPSRRMSLGVPSRKDVAVVPMVGALPALAAVAPTFRQGSPRSGGGSWPRVRDGSLRRAWLLCTSPRRRASCFCWPVALALGTPRLIIWPASRSLRPFLDGLAVPKPIRTQWSPRCCDAYLFDSPLRLGACS